MTDESESSKAVKVPQFLVTMAELLGLSVLIERVADAFDASNQTKASLVVVFVLMLTLYLYRGNLRRLISGSQDLPKGIIRIYQKANEFLPQLSRHIQKAKHEILIVGVNFYVTVPERRQDFLDAIKRGVNVRFLVYNHLSPTLGEVATGFSQTPEELIRECLITIEGLRWIDNEARKLTGAHGAFEVRLFHSDPRTRFYFFDRGTENGIVYFVPHVDRVNSPNVPGFLAHTQKEGLAATYQEGVDLLWTSSIPLSEWLPMYEHTQTA